MELAAGRLAQSPKAISFDQLVDEVLSRHVQPEDKYEVAAILESMGWNDRTAAEFFGVEDIFALAANIWDAIQVKILFVPASPVEKISTLQYLVLILRSFLRGTIFALPMAVSVFSMLTLRFSLWSYEYLSLENATSIAMGTILSFMAVGGFTQAIARRGFMYVGQGHYYMARRVTFYFVKIGYVVCLLSAGAFIVFSLVFAVFPWHMTVIIVLYFLFLSAIWLSVTIMYILQKELIFTGLIIGGITTVFILFKLLAFNIIFSQVIALILVSIAGILTAHYFFMKAEKEMEKGIAPPMPRLSIIAYTSIPFFTYGFLYFTFLFTDRVMAWSTNNLFMPYLIWFRGEYELGLDFALITMILPMGVVEVVVNEIMLNLEANEKNHMASESGRLSRLYVLMYFKRMAFVTLFSAVNAAALYLLIRYLSNAGTFELNIFTSPTTHFVFAWSVVAYAVVAVALMNTLILFCLSQPEMVYRSTLYSFLINLFLGFVLSRWVDHSWAVFGLLVGALAFVIITSQRVLKVLKNIDYYLYAAS